MSRLIDKSRFLAAALVSATWGASLVAQDPLLTSRLVDEASSGDVERFAASLVASSVPLGVVLLGQDSRRSTAAADLRSDGPDVPLSKVVQAFLEHRPAYRLYSNSDGVLVLAPQTAGCTAGLAMRASAFRATGAAFAITHDIARWWTRDTRTVPAPGLIAQDPAFRSVVTVDTPDGARLIDALNQVVRQANLGWAIRERPPNRSQSSSEAPRSIHCNIVLFSGESWIDTTWNFVVQRK